MRVLAENVVIGRQTGLQTKYINPRCAHARQGLLGLAYIVLSASRRVCRSVQQ